MENTGGKQLSKVIGIMGESGAGKTTSIRNLDPKETYIIDADKKGLSWRGWKQQYNSESKNYVTEDNPINIRTICKGISDSRPHIKNIVIDTLNGAMVADEMRRSKEKGYDKWADLATSIYYIVDDALRHREDLTFIFICHSQTDMNENGLLWTKIKTSGKKIDKISLETKFTTLLLAKCIDGRYIFETQSRNSTAKSPMGAFSEFEIPNDIKAVIEALNEF